MRWFSALILTFFALSTGVHSLAQDYATLGTLQHGAKFEIGVSFNVQVNRNSALTLENFKLNTGEIVSARFVPQNEMVILSAGGLTLNSAYSLTMTNLVDSGGTTLNDLTKEFRTTPFSWVQIGADELGLGSEAVAIGTNGVDLICGGFEMWDRYDESTFAFQQVTGDFDVKVRVDSQDATSFEARAGLMVRESLDEGKTRPANPFDLEQAFSRFIQLHVTPELDSEGQPASNNHQLLIRPYTGGIDSPNFDAMEVTNYPNSTPTYTNAWLRLKRTGKTFTAFRGEDGLTWTELGTYTFPATDATGHAFPGTVYVGVNYSPETGNIPEGSGDRTAYMAQFRDFEIISSPAAPDIAIEKEGSTIRVTWTGTAVLQQNSSLTPNTWADIQGATNPYTPQPQTTIQFFRLRL